MHCLNTELGAAVQQENLLRHITALSTRIGQRSFLQYPKLEMAAEYIKGELTGYGYVVREQVYSAENQTYRNIIAARDGRGNKDKVIIVCSHYDSVSGSPGADDNASGVAGLLELARLISQGYPGKTVEFIATVNEEPPWFTTQGMGSLVYAKEARGNKKDIEAVLCLESIGFYSEGKDSQGYPLFLKPFYPDKGNFIAVVSNLASAGLLKKVVRGFRKASDFPVEYLIAPAFFTPAISLSDHWSFWKFGYKAVMITDTAFYRNPYYHTPQDTAETIDYRSMSKVIKGLYDVLFNLAR